MPLYAISRDFLPVIQTGIAKGSFPGALTGLRTINPKQTFRWKDIFELTPKDQMLVFDNLRDAKTAAVLCSRPYSGDFGRVDYTVNQFGSLVIFEFDDAAPLIPTSIIDAQILSSYPDYSTLLGYFTSTVEAERMHANTMLMAFKMFPPDFKIPQINCTFGRPNGLPIRVYFQMADGKFVKQDIGPEVMQNPDSSFTIASTQSTEGLSKNCTLGNVLVLRPKM